MRPDLILPPGATDCHLHAFGDPARYPLSPSRAYTPGLADAGQLRGFLSQLGLSRAVVVQPSVYGHDNACTLDAAALPGDSGRAVLEFDAAIDDAALAAYQARGARGLRLNLLSNQREGAEAALRRLQQAAGRLRGSGWHLQIFGRFEVIAALAPAIRDAGLPVVLDHFAMIGSGATSLAEDALALPDLLWRTRSALKLSAPQRVTHDPDACPVLEPLVRQLARLVPDRLLWGSDWPHTSSRRAAGPALPEPFEPIDDRLALRRLERWIADDAVWRAMLVGNPARLYGFPDPA